MLFPFRIGVTFGCALLLNDFAAAQTQANPENRVALPPRLTPRVSEVRELDGATFPLPPQQNAPWKAARDDAFSQVVTRLFKAGLADPRGAQYREVELVAGPTRWTRPGQTAPQLRAFVLPSTDEKARFAVTWNGQIYRVTSVAQPKDWRADWAQMAKKPLVAARQSYFGGEQIEADFSTPTPLKAILAARLGAPRALPFELHLSSAAADFVSALSTRAKNAHLRGDDPTAFALLQKEKAALQSLREVFEAKDWAWMLSKHDAATLNRFKAVAGQWAWMLTADDALLSDQTRRALELQRLSDFYKAEGEEWEREANQNGAPSPEPVPRASESKTTPTDAKDMAIARLIWNLQNVRAHQMSSPGDVNFLEDHTVRQLVELGDDAVLPLITVVERDDRLTRSARLNRMNGGVGQILPVSMAAYDALTGIWDVGMARYELFGGRDEVSDPQKRALLVAKLRAYQKKYAGITPLERQFAVLQDDSAKPQQWLDAIRALSAPTRLAFFGSTVRVKFDPKTKTYLPDEDLTPRGAALKSKTAPSVSDLIEKRALETTRRALSAPVKNYEAHGLLRTANGLILEGAKWDLPRLMPLLKTQAARNLHFAAQVPAGYREDARNMAQDAQLQFFRARIRSSQAAERHLAAHDYAIWLQKQPFGDLETRFYAPLWRFKNEAALQNAAQKLFGAPRKPFEELLRRAGQKESAGYYMGRGFDLIDTPLVTLAAFRGAIQRELNNKTPIGTLKYEAKAQFRVTFRSGDGTDGQVAPAERTAPRAPDKAPIRVADVVAARVLEWRGPQYRYPMVEFWWPQTRRDHAIALVKARFQNGKYTFDTDPPFVDF